MAKAAAKKSNQKKSGKNNHLNTLLFVISFLIVGVSLAVTYSPLQQQTTITSNASFEKATVTWDALPNTTSYNLYYKKAADANFTVAINIPAKYTYYTFSDLEQGVDYEYKIAGVNADNKEFVWTPVSQLQK
jgi:hypothetical protein